MFIDQLNSRAQACQLEYIPDDITQQAKLCILDTIGCIVAGMQDDTAKFLVAPGNTAATVNNSATVFVHGHKLPIRDAVLANGYAGDILELNDLIGGHASIGCVTAALAAAEISRSSGRTLIEAVVRALESTASVYNVIYPSLKPYNEVGMTPVGIPSSVGAAAGVAHLYDLDSETTRHALAIACALAGWCPSEVIFRQGGTFKPMLFGAQPAATALDAVQYAQRGMTGPLEILDGELGYFSTVSTHGRQDACVNKNHWILRSPRRKMHACCGYIHSAADALSALRTESDSTLEDVEIKVKVPEYVHKSVSKTVLPSTPNEARFDIRYCLAVIACGANVITPEHSLNLQEQIKRPDVQRMMSRITVIPDTQLTHYERSHVTIRHRTSGQTITKTQNAPRGAPSLPLTKQDLIDKFLLLTQWCIPTDQALRYAQQILSLETAENIDWIFTGLQHS